MLIKEITQGMLEISMIKVFINIPFHLDIII